MRPSKAGCSNSQCRRMDSEGLAGSGWHWSTPRRFEAV
nr:MAG TPA: hypothetical protein [Caudoviricetes sp.]